YSPFFQKKEIDWTSGWAYDRWGISVQVDEIRFRLFNTLYLQGFLLSNQDVDSLIHISERQLPFDANPLKLMRKELSLSGLEAETVKIRLLANYTPQLTDTSETSGFVFNFLPANVHVQHVDFALKDTVTQVHVMVRTDLLKGAVQ